MAAARMTITETAAWRRYSSVAVLLHWSIAALIIFNLITGLIHDDVSKPVQHVMMPLHFSAGITVLLLTVLRIAWRLTHRPPPMDRRTTRYERAAANTVYVLFYAGMLLMPLLGWAIISSHPPKPGPAMMLWGVIPWPALGPAAQIAPAAVQKHWNHVFADWHGIGGWIMLGLLALHIAGALKHQLFDRIPELQRMSLAGRSQP
jgi:cytochrome b561